MTGLWCFIPVYLPLSCVKAPINGHLEMGGDNDADDALAGPRSMRPLLDEFFGVHTLCILSLRFLRAAKPLPST